METFKTIFSGSLEFGSTRSYDKVLKMYQHRLENYYKSDILIDGEAFFTEESSSLVVPRFITQASDKSWKNTLNLLEYVAQYAVAGDLSVWMTENGKVLRHKVIEPLSEKAAVQAFRKGRELISVTGKENEAKAALSVAIEKFERHARAYERRGFVNLQLGNLKDAHYDYSKSIDINPSAPEAYFGRGYLHLKQGNIEEAIKDFQACIPKSIPLQSIYWQARRMKSECHLILEDFEGVVGELKFFVKRNFLKENPNFKFRRNAFYKYGMALAKLGKNEEALKALDQALVCEDFNKDTPDSLITSLKDTINA